MIAWVNILILFALIFVSAAIVVGAVRFAERGYPKDRPGEWLDEEGDV